MKFTIGEKVGFLYETGGGTIIKAKDNVSDLAVKLKKYQNQLSEINDKYNAGGMALSDFQRKSNEVQVAMSDIQVRQKSIIHI